MTFRSAIFDKRVRISSWMPSAKYAFSLSLLRFSKGSTAMLFSDIEGAVSERFCAVVGGARWKKIKKLTASATADPSTASNNTDFGKRDALMGRTGTEI